MAAITAQAVNDFRKQTGLGLMECKALLVEAVARNQRVASRLDGAVIKLDSGMNRAVYRGHPAAVLLEKDTARVVYADEGHRLVKPEHVVDLNQRLVAWFDHYLK